MRLELREDGAVLLREVTDEAWEYIERERARANPYYWCFSMTRYDGIVYVRHEEAIAYLDRLMECYDVEIGESVKPLLAAWRKLAEWDENTSVIVKECDGLHAQCKMLKSIIKNGCANCRYFKERQAGDDLNGYCSACEKEVELESSSLLPAYGSMKGGTLYWGQKYYPHENCAYVKEEV